LSINSMATGKMPEPMMSDTALAVSSRSVKLTIRVRVVSGLGTTLKMASVTRPRVPSEPQNRAAILYPVTSLTFLEPKRTILPSAMTTSSPRI